MKQAIVICVAVFATIAMLSYAQSVGDYTPGSREGGAAQAIRVDKFAAGTFVVTSQVGIVTLYPSAVNTATVQNAKSAGEIIHIINMAATNVVFADSGNLELSSAATLNQYDSLTLLAVATNTWIEIGQQDN